MASSTCDDALVNPVNTDQRTHQYPPATSMDYQNFQDEHFVAEGYGPVQSDSYDHGESEVYCPDETEGFDQENIDGEQFGPEAEDDGGEFDSSGYGENEPPDFCGETESYVPAGIKGGQFRPIGDGGRTDSEEFENTGGYDEEEFGPVTGDEAYDPVNDEIEDDIEDSESEESDFDDDYEEEEYEDSDEEDEQEEVNPSFGLGMVS